MWSRFVVVRHENIVATICSIVVAESVIGRSRHCGLQLPNPLVSREHALLVATPQECRIRDLGSQNGTYVNGVRIEGEETLSDGAEIGIRPYSLTICFDVRSVIRASVSSDDSTQLVDDGPDTRDLDSTLTELLTPTQCIVCAFLAQGFVEKEVAARMNLSIHTVHGHVKAIYKALQVSTRGELVSRWLARNR